MSYMKIHDVTTVYMTDKKGAQRMASKLIARGSWVCVAQMAGRDRDAVMAIEFVYHGLPKENAIFRGVNFGILCDPTPGTAGKKLEQHHATNFGFHK